MKGSYTEKDGVLYDEDGDAVFTEEMKRDYTLLVPDMCDIHFTMLMRYFRHLGYNVELLRDTDTRNIAECGLKYVHNDICYPATLVIGLLIRTVMSGKYDTHKLAVVISQTGGGCRASNYLFLLKKALKKSGYGYVPVLSFNTAGLSPQPGFKFSFDQIFTMAKIAYYGDILMNLRNQCEPYEAVKGESRKLVDEWCTKITSDFSKKGLKGDTMLENISCMLDSFGRIERRKEDKPKVGIVGEIYVKYSPLGNNELEKFLLENGAEVVVPGLMDFMFYSIMDGINDYEMYGEGGRLTYWITGYVMKEILKFQRKVKSLFAEHPEFRGIKAFDEVIPLSDGLVDRGVNMGEGWLLTAEIIELIEEGVNNVIITQPFGCLPNHIIGRGMLKTIKESHPGANIIAVDYDTSASRVNQENRIRLLLSNALDDEIPVINR